MSKEAPDDPSEWGVEEVCAWASGLHLESASAQSVSEALARNDVDGAVLVALDNATLRDDIGVSSFGLRRKLLAAIDALRPTVDPIFAPIANQSPTLSCSFPPIEQLEFLLPSVNMINTHAHSQKQLAAKPQQSVRSRNTFASKNFDFEWNSLNRPASSAKDALVFGLKPSNAPTSEASDSFYFFKRSSRIQKNSVLVRAIQKKMKRMLSRQNLFMFNRDSLDTNSNIRDLYNSIPNISSSGIIAIWKVPSASNTSTSPNYVRVFKKLGKNNIADFVDNSGKYSGEHIFNLIVPTQAPSMLNKGSKFNNPNDEDDEVLPLYGDSDSDLFELDAEWAQEIRESERERLGKIPKSSKPQTDETTVLKPDTTTSTVAETVQEGDAEVYLDIFKSLDEPSLLQSSPSPVPDSNESTQLQLPYISQSGPLVTREDTSTALIRATIATQIENQETAWSERHLPSLQTKSYRIYCTRATHVAGYRAALEDLSLRRLPKLVQGIVDFARGSGAADTRAVTLREVKRMCENLRMSVYDRMELEWRVGVCEREEAPGMDIPWPERMSIKRVEGVENAGEEDGTEDEHWSDFIASEDGGVENHMIHANADKGQMSDAMEEEEALQNGPVLDQSRFASITSVGGQPKPPSIQSEASLATSKARKKRRKPIQSSTRQSHGIGPNFHLRYLKAMKLLETGLDAFLNEPGMTLDEFRLFQEYTVFISMAQLTLRSPAAIGDAVGGSAHVMGDFKLLTVNLETEFCEWRSTADGFAELDEDGEMFASNAVKRKAGKRRKKRNFNDNDSLSSDGDDEMDMDDDDDANELDRLAGLDAQGATGHADKGRRQLKPITEESEVVKSMHANRKMQEEAANERAIQQYQVAIQSGNREKVIINLGHDDTEEHIYVDDFLAMHLKPHQVKGVQFLWRSIVMIRDEREGVLMHQGCILAHAMGLGKTLQTIAFIYTLQREVQANNPCLPDHIKTGGILVVCPSVVIDNWVNEIFKWIPVKERNDVLGGVFTFSNDTERLSQLESWRERNGVFIISYQMMRTVLSLKRPEPQEDNNPLPDVSKFHEFLLSPGPALVVCDESHMIKNPKSGIGIYIGNIATKSRICLTGWPLQNNLEEYFAMIDFVSRGFLGTLGEFRNQYVHPIANGFYADSTEADKIISKQRLFVLVNIINPLLQRIDDDILKDDLPPKTEYIVSVRLSKIQKNIYKSYLAHLRATADVSNIISRFPTFVTVCNHPSICKSAADGKALDPDSESFYDNSVIKSILAQQDVTDWTDSQLSLKIVLLEHIVTQSVALGDKVLVFSRSIPTIEFIKMKLSKFKLLVMTGSTNHRQRLIDDFNNSEKGFNVFIISTVAGGIGVNVASANRVVLMDHSWNPSGEQQAISRSYRYGQTKTVYIYRLLTYGAFEERIFQKNMYKIILSTQVVDKRAMEKNAFFKAEMKQYFVDPPEAPESQLVTGAVYNDSVMQSAVELFGKDIIKVETSEELFREVEDELTEAQREMAKDTLKKEVIRRRNGAKFKETSRTAAFSSSTTAFNLGSSDTLVQQHFIDLTTDDVDAMELDRSPPLPPSKPSTSGQPSRSKQLLQTDWEETDIAFMALSGSLLDDYDS